MRPGKKCYQYDEQGKFVAVHDSIAAASRILNIDKSSICSAINHKYSTTNYCSGYFWFNEDKGSTIQCSTNRKLFTYDVVTSGKKMYETFCKQFPSVKLTYQQYKETIEEINCYYREHLLETGNVVFLPFGNGKMMVQKNKRILKPGTRKLPLNWQETRKQGKHVYNPNNHTDGYSYRYMWFNNSSYIEPISIWKMVMTKESRDMLTAYLEDTDKPYKQMYRECYSKNTTQAVKQKIQQLKPAAHE